MNSKLNENIAYFTGVLLGKSSNKGNDQIEVLAKIKTEIEQNQALSSQFHKEDIEQAFLDLFEHIAHIEERRYTEYENMHAQFVAERNKHMEVRAELNKFNLLTNKPRR
ncbi:MAG: hypothetical protein K0U41_06560 [Gammaproteobacteria bacterium]|nr:hypothetical protein [Gammaproteobacteria bacterium]